MRLLFAWVALLATVVACGQRQGVKIVHGDKIAVVVHGHEAYSGVYAVPAGGSVSMAVIGPVNVTGRYLQEVERDVHSKVAKFIREPVVTVSFVELAKRFVYLVGERVSDGEVIWHEDMTLRQLVAMHTSLSDPASYKTTLYRAGQKPLAIDLKALLDTTDDPGTILEPEDVLSILPKADQNVWVTGNVLRPGLVRLAPGSQLNQAVASAGGAQVPETLRAESKIVLQRGTSVSTFPLAEIDSAKVTVQDGDIVSVTVPVYFPVTVGGFVQNPGQVMVREGSNTLAAVQLAGGVLPNGSIRSAILFRDGAATVFDAMPESGQDAPALKTGDFVFVPENIGAVRVFGAVVAPGRYMLPENQNLTLLDAVGLARGPGPRGTLTRVMLVRAGPNGALSSKTYRLDKLGKDASADQNPVLLPGDIVFVDDAKSPFLQDALRLLPSLLLIERLF